MFNILLMGGKTISFVLMLNCYIPVVSPRGEGWKPNLPGVCSQLQNDATAFECWKLQIDQLYHSNFQQIQGKDPNHSAPVWEKNTTPNWPIFKTCLFLLQWSEVRKFYLQTNLPMLLFLMTSKKCPIFGSVFSQPCCLFVLVLNPEPSS